MAALERRLGGQVQRQRRRAENADALGTRQGGVGVSALLVRQLQSKKIAVSGARAETSDRGADVLHRRRCPLLDMAANDCQQFPGRRHVVRYSTSQDALGGAED